MYWRPGEQPDTIHVYAPAKLNLTLEVGPAREDGYHPIASVMVPVSLADEIILTRREDGQITLDVTMADPLGIGLSADDDNLALRAARLLQSTVAGQTGELLGASIRLVKHIPVAAGLAGGSTDAAAVLMGLNRLWQVGLRSSELAELGASLGADVPFCIRARSGLVEGIGEQYTPLAGVPSIPVVLLNPRKPLSTRRVFEAYDETGPHPLPGERTMHMVRTLFTGEITSIAKAVYNDLEPCARRLAPEVSAMEECLTRAGALAVQVTGSGPTVFGIAANEEQARKTFERCVAAIGDEGTPWWVWWGWAGAIEGLAPYAPVPDATATMREG